MIRVFLVVDQPITRAVLRLRLELEADIVVVGEAGNDEVTVAQVDALTPDVVICDSMTPAKEIACERLREFANDFAVVVLSLHDDKANRRCALAAGAEDVVSKYGTDGLLIAAIRSAAVARTQPGSDL